MNYHGLPSHHPSEIFRARISHPEHQELIARAALKHVPGADKVLDKVFNNQIQQKPLRKVETQTFYHGMDKPH